MALVAESPHNKYGSAVFIKKDPKVNSISVCKQGTVELITVEMSGVAVHYVYKPPTEPFILLALGHSNLPHIVIGYFNRHNNTWGYTNTDDDGNSVEQWKDSCNLCHLFTIQNFRSHSTVQDGRIQPIPHICIVKHCQHVIV